MAHPLVDQFRFTRSEWLLGLEGLSEEDGSKHFGQMNCISWIVGHLAWQEQRYFLDRAQGKILYPKLNEIFAFRHADEHTVIERDARDLAHGDQSR